VAKKKKYNPPKTSEEESIKFREHINMINEKIKAISSKYRKWWDKETKTWKKGFKHGGKDG
jgi:hypothetical protein